MTSIKAMSTMGIVMVMTIIIMSVTTGCIATSTTAMGGVITIIGTTRTIISIIRTRKFHFRLVSSSAVVYQNQR